MAAPQEPRPPERAAAAGLASDCFPWTVLTVLIVLGSSVFLFLGRSDEPKGGTPQRTYVDEIGQARRQLFTGELVRTDTGSLHLVAGGEPRQFRARIMGTWHADGPGETHSPTSAGAEIGVKLHCSGAHVRCTPLSSERQNVLSKSDSATWLWDVGAERAGTVSMTLTVTAYYRDTDTVLLEKPPLTARVEVASPPGDGLAWLKQPWRWLSGAITSLGGLAVSLSAVITLAVMVARRRTPAAGSDPADPGE
ncbi:hypothetical protein ACFVTY_08240 [Streptomyces sp. NPDC058067]|uniref:hypothetical protein n=1 Tax=Streptomyces sp. NPDC058067 TaxID=3346324 RepID=UPI0036E5B070